MNNVIIIALILLLSGCANRESKQSDIFSYVSNGELVQLQKAVDSKVELDIVDQFGQTPMHHAAPDNNAALKILLAGGANPSIQDKLGFTPLHYAVQFNNASAIVPLLRAGTDTGLRTFSSTWCTSKGRIRAEKGLTALDFGQRCRQGKIVKVLQRYESDISSWQMAQNINTIDSYRDYLRHVQAPLFRYRAQTLLDEIIDKRLTKLEKQQPCQLNLDGWYLVSGQCENGLAHGEGKAVTLENKQFIGSFTQGAMNHGELSFKGEMLWHGPIEAGKPHGEGVCVFDGSPEECKCFHGERIDSLYKQRELMVAYMAKFEHQMGALRNEIESTSQGEEFASQLDYIGDLNSKNDYKRTSAQIQAAIDLFKALSR